MKSFRLIYFTAVLLLSGSVFAQQEKVVIESSRFAVPLAEKWAEEYEKVNPGVDIVLIKGNSSDDEVDLSLSSLGNIPAARFALLPVTNVDNPNLKELNRKKLNSKDISELFFVGNILEGSSESNKTEFDLTVYSGNNSDSFAEAFASHFGYMKADIKGKRISGDDIFLVNAIQKDNEGVAFNNLSYIFDVETRNLKEGLAIISLDIKNEHIKVLGEENIDKAIDLLENESISLIPIETFGFISEKENNEAARFLDWVLTEGQKYNKEYGFLRVSHEHLVNN